MTDLYWRTLFMRFEWPGIWEGVKCPDDEVIYEDENGTYITRCTSSSFGVRS